MRYIFYTEGNINSPLFDNDKNEILKTEGIPFDNLFVGSKISFLKEDYIIIDITKGVNKSPTDSEELNILLEKIE